MTHNPKYNRKKQRPQPRKLTENDLEALRISRGATISQGIVDCVKTALKWGAILGCAICIYLSVKCIVTGVTGIADKIADILHALFMDDIVYWLVILLLTGSNTLRKWRNRRLTEKDGELRHELEKKEKANTPSGLNPLGEACEDKE